MCNLSGGLDELKVSLLPHERRQVVCQTRLAQLNCQRLQLLLRVVVDHAVVVLGILKHKASVYFVINGL